MRIRILFLFKVLFDYTHPGNLVDREESIVPDMGAEHGLALKEFKRLVSRRWWCFCFPALLRCSHPWSLVTPISPQDQLRWKQLKSHTPWNEWTLCFLGSALEDLGEREAWIFSLASFQGPAFPSRFPVAAQPLLFLGKGWRRVRNIQSLRGNSRTPLPIHFLSSHSHNTI